jgi:hypothetical protein
LNHYEAVARPAIAISRIDQAIREMATGLSLAKVLDFPVEPPLPSSSRLTP